MAKRLGILPIYPSLPLEDFSRINFFEIERTPTVYPLQPFSPVEDAKKLQQALKKGDTKVLIDVITKRSNAQRQQIVLEYKTMYGKNLIKQLKSKLRGNNFQTMIVGLMMPPMEFYAQQLHKAISGIGTNEKAIIEILSIHTNAEITAIREAYRKMYKNSLESDIKGDTSRFLKRLLVGLVTARRDESERVDIDLAYKDAQALLRAGELVPGTDVSIFSEVLCQRNKSQLKLIFDEYQLLTGHDFETAVENEFSGTTRDVLLALVQGIRSPTSYLAGRIYSSLNRIKTDNTTLIRIVVSRSEIDLGEIKEVFCKSYGDSLANFIRATTSSHYQNCMLSIVGLAYS